MALVARANGLEPDEEYRISGIEDKPMSKRSRLQSNIYDWLDLLDKEDPMDALDEVREAIRESKIRSEETIHNSIGFIAECLRMAMEDAEYLRSLLSTPIFSGDHSGPRKVAITIARYLLDVTETSGPPYEKARSYGKVAEYFAETDWGPSEIAKYLGKHGIRNSLEHFQKVEREAVIGEKDTCEQGDDSEEVRPELIPDPAPSEGRGPEGTNTAPPTARKVAVERALSRDPPAKPARPKLNYDTMLVLEASENLLAQMFELEVGESANITAYRERNHEGQDFYRFTIANIVSLTD